MQTGGIDITQLIGNLGFPIAVTCYMLFRDSKIISGLTDALNDLKAEIQKGRPGQ